MDWSWAGLPMTGGAADCLQARRRVGGAGLPAASPVDAAGACNPEVNGVDDPTRVAALKSLRVEAEAVDQGGLKGRWTIGGGLQGRWNRGGGLRGRWKRGGYPGILGAMGVAGGGCAWRRAPEGGRVV